MIHHVSISARDPQHVAEVLASLMGGRCFPFPGSVPDSWMAVDGDEIGTMIEVYPEDVTLSPGQGEAEPVMAVRGQGRPATVPFHFLLSVSADVGTMMAVGAREGWRTRLQGRGAPGEAPMFHVVEFWIENRLMVELAPHDMMDGYVEAMQFRPLERLFARRRAAAREMA